MTVSNKVGNEVLTQEEEQACFHKNNIFFKLAVTLKTMNLFCLIDIII